MGKAWNGHVTIDGHEMYYVAFGEGPRTAAVLPGLSDGLATVRGKALMLRRIYKKYLKDFIVYMFSRREDLPRGYTISQMAEDQSEAFRQLGLSRVDLLGVSQGGMIAQYLAAEHPEQIRRLCLAVTAPYADEGIRNSVRYWMACAEEDDHKALMIDSTEKTYSGRTLKRYRRLYPLMGKMGKPENYSRFLANCDAILTFDAREELKKISCPVLILGGEIDRTVGPEAAYELHRLLPESECFVYAQYGHGAFEEAEDYNDRVFRFFGKE